MCRVIGAIMSGYVLVSELRPLLAQNKILIQYRALKPADPDQPNALSFASVGVYNLDAYACFLGSTWRGDHVERRSWAFIRAFWLQFEHILFIKTNCAKPESIGGKVTKLSWLVASTARYSSILVNLTQPF